MLDLNIRRLAKKMRDFPNRFRQSLVTDFPYFRRVWNNVVVALMAAAFIPLILIGGGIYSYTSSVFKQNVLDSLNIEALNHKSRIDLFLAERTMDLKTLSATLGLAYLTRSGTLANVLVLILLPGRKEN